ncbi:MAG: hypothetical protein ACFCVD_03285 [Nodosilinea sp.]
MKAPIHGFDAQLSGLPLSPQRPSSPAQQSMRQEFLEWLQQRSQRLISSMTDSTNPQIRQLRDGDLRWRAYDPISGQRASFSSENELRQWLEQRYYR